MTSPDLIIVGAGSAGCMMACRLRALTDLNVMVVEPPSAEAPPIDRQRPSRWMKLIESDENWNHTTGPNIGLANRKLAWPRGRGIGGSSRINAMIWFSPTESDFDSWAEASGGRHSIADWRNAALATEAMIQPESPRYLSESSESFLAAAKDLDGATPMVYRRFNRQGRRLDLTPMLSGCTVVRATVDRILWDSDRAMGVSVMKDGATVDLVSRLGVILCGGAIATPTILQRSGVGNPSDLLTHGIDVRIPRPLVGQQLQDHLVMPVIFKTRAKKIFRLNPPLRDVARWQMLGTGQVASNVAECGGLFGDGRFQLHVTPTNYLTFPTPSEVAVMTIAVNLTQPLSQGQIGLGGVDPTKPALIQSNYFADARDAESLAGGVQMARAIAARDPLANFIIDEVLPGTRRSDVQAITKSMSRYAQTLYHPVGTCRMCRRNDSVVDAEFRVRDSTGLWAVDASVLPGLPLGNPTASVMTMAYLAADQIARDTHISHGI
ncbi:Alcohol dehydrogenase [acceptor] [Rubripirellula lacrimiformis]|uniref:Alcohol dehydrogenase [acceptor] n=1 Tax=Rubripirellula lacrimiformis TaxID=1930273 RepID=A0A517NKL9_9BACT|nr:GMC oxidoreductase [Rubripirellula lacrimiformis]QDT07681.1 Alcohol dehydrogenase [acceptor] [Rubripirellula lacrimiformis]